MATKEKIKKKIDQLSQDDLERVYLYLSSLSQKDKQKTQISSYKLKGKLDKTLIRSLAYE